LLKKEISIPLSCSVFVAVTTFIFYSISISLVSIDLMGRFIAVFSLSAMLQTLFVPQTWIYVFSAKNLKDRVGNVSIAVIMECLGFFTGLLIVLSVIFFLNQQKSLLYSFIALSFAGSNSSIGFLRGEKRWTGFIACFTMPTILRLITLIVSINNGDLATISLNEFIINFFLIPELVRYFIFTGFIVSKYFEFCTLVNLKKGIANIYSNWFYDLGSSIVDIGDKYFLSFMVSPKLLVIYFFVRKIGSATTIITETFYANCYSLFRNLHDYFFARSVLIKGYGLALITAFSILILVEISKHISLLGVFPVPSIVISELQIFAILVFIDAFITANKWGRYLSLISNKALNLLYVRLANFIIFIIFVYFANSILSSSRSLISGFLIYCTIDFFYVAYLITLFNSKGSGK